MPVHQTARDVHRDSASRGVDSTGAQPEVSGIAHAVACARDAEDATIHGDRAPERAIEHTGIARATGDECAAIDGHAAGESGSVVRTKIIGFPGSRVHRQHARVANPDAGAGGIVERVDTGSGINSRAENHSLVDLQCGGARQSGEKPDGSPD
jgi:hypothetical protein